jgi:hypothetical protein
MFKDTDEFNVATYCFYNVMLIARKNNKSKLTPNRNGKHQQENAKGTQQSREITLKEM